MTSYNVNEIKLGVPLETIYGGTGINNYNEGDIIYASSPNVLSKLPIGLTGQYISNNGTNLSWSNVAIESSGGDYSLIDAGLAPVMKIRGLNIGSGLTIENNTTHYTLDVKSVYNMKLIDTQTFTSNGNWVKPTGAVYVYACLIGGGAGGGGGGKVAIGMGSPAGYAGMGGGVCVINAYPANLLPNSVSVTVGLGGTGGLGSTLNDTIIPPAGGLGGSTLFGPFKATGGGIKNSEVSKTFPESVVITENLTNYTLYSGDTTRRYPSLTSNGGLGSNTPSANSFPGESVILKTHNVDVPGTAAPGNNQNGLNGSNYVFAMFNTNIQFGLGGSGGKYASGSTPYNGGNGGLYGGGGGGGSGGVNNVVDGGNGGNGGDGYAIILTYN